MTPRIIVFALFAVLLPGLVGAGPRQTAAAQESAFDADGGSADDGKSPQDGGPADDGKSTEDGGPLGPAVDVASDIAKRVDGTAERVDRDPRAKELSAGILDPIYRLAEYFSFSWFHWLAFALMSAGVVGFAGQLVLGKLVMLAKLHFSLMEILSDALGLMISLVGLVLTTQAATENSEFTGSAFSVLSASAVGALVGFLLYVQGQSQEIRAARATKEKRKQKD